MEPIAIIGLACRFPGANDPDEYWRLLTACRNLIGPVPPERWDPARLSTGSLSPAENHSLEFGAFLDQVTDFDWRAFGMLPREVRHLDPQHRLLLELAWEAFEDAGLPFDRVAGSPTAVFVGSQWQDYLRLLARRWSNLDGYAAIGNTSALAANRISYTFDLRGPSVALDTGCASALSALQSACQSLWLGDAELALVGAAELLLAPETGIMMAGTGMLSQSGECRLLDSRGDGFVRGEGAGMLVLKPVSRLEPSDRVYARVQAVAINHNGHNEWLMAASDQTQQELIHAACAKAGIEPEDLDYVELHGTGNAKGDVVEMKALESVFQKSKRPRPLLIGGCKPNLGHLGAASGMASLIKVALALHRGIIPPTKSPSESDAAVELASSNLTLCRKLSSWPNPLRPALAGVTTLSLGGVNAFALLTQHVHQVEAKPSSSSKACLLPLSARDPQALQDTVKRFLVLLQDMEDVDLEDLCYTASVRRSHHSCRVAVVGSSTKELLSALSSKFDQWEEHDFQSSPVSESARNGSCSDKRPAAQLEEDEPGLRANSLDTIAELYRQGQTIFWDQLYPNGGKVLSLPSYPWQRQRLWPDWLTPERITTPPEEGNQPPVASPERGSLAERFANAKEENRLELLREYLQTQVVGVLGAEGLVPYDETRPFTELGLNSLTAIELRSRIEFDLGVRVPMGELLSGTNSDQLTQNLFDQFELRMLVRTVSNNSSGTIEEDEEKETLRL